MRGLCLSFDYARMAATAKRLLTNFNQVNLSTVEVITAAGAGPFDPPSDTTASTQRQGVARGVSSKFVDGVNILHTDLQLMLEAVEIGVGSRVTVDGKPVTVLRVDQIPPAGVAVVTRVFVRS